MWFHLDWSLEGGEEKNLTQMTEEKPHHTKTDEAAEWEGEEGGMQEG